ncbi:MAG: CinA family protein [Gammaproteobacteria bacterium]
MSSSITSLTQATAGALRARGLKLVTAESCTGGWLAKVLTDLAGSSAWFERGFVTYSDEAKIELLGVDPRTLQTHGAVSERTAREMALGAHRNSRAHIAVAITGVAGPDGGTAAKPVGTVWIAWLCRSDDVVCLHHRFEGDRERVRHQSVVAALEGILRLVR